MTNDLNKATKPKRVRSVMIPNPWDGGKMTLREYYEREEKERDIDHEIVPEGLPDGQKMYLNHISYDGASFQFLLHMGAGYSGQSLFFRRQKNNEKFIPIAIKCHIPEEYLFTVAGAFEKHGVAGAKYALGVS